MHLYVRIIETPFARRLRDADVVNQRSRDRELLAGSVLNGHTVCNGAVVGYNGMPVESWIALHVRPIGGANDVAPSYTSCHRVSPSC
jgi:hypothetical protein